MVVILARLGRVHTLVELHLIPTRQHMEQDPIQTVQHMDVRIDRLIQIVQYTCVQVKPIWHIRGILTLLEVETNRSVVGGSHIRWSVYLYQKYDAPNTTISDQTPLSCDGTLCGRIYLGRQSL